MVDSKKEIAIRIEHVSKQYRLGMIGGTTLREEMQRKLAKLKGKEDPTRKLGEQNRGKTGELFYALDDVSFEVRKGESVALFGRNGCGKSTTLKMVTGVTFPTEGEVYVKGKVSALLELTAGFDNESTGRENIGFKCSLMGMTEEEIAAVVEDIIEFADIGEYIDQPLRSYSSGMRARLGFAISVNSNPDILIVDEALSVGDKNFQKKCKDKVAEIMKDEDVTLLFVTHSLSTARDFCREERAAARKRAAEKKAAEQKAAEQQAAAQKAAQTTKQEA